MFNKPLKEVIVSRCDVISLGEFKCSRRTCPLFQHIVKLTH